MKHKLFGLAIALGLAALTRLAGAVPNVLQILADDLGVEALSVYGLAETAPKTAALEELAQQGVFGIAVAMQHFQMRRVDQLPPVYHRLGEILGILEHELQVDMGSVLRQRNRSMTCFCPPDGTPIW